MAEERPLVHLFLIQKNMPYDALQAVSCWYEEGDSGLVRGEERSDGTQSKVEGSDVKRRGGEERRGVKL